MKRLLVVLLAAVMLSSCMMPYNPKATEREKTVTVHGFASVKGHADTAVITFSVVTLEWVVKVASESNAAITTRVYDAIKAAGVGTDDINTADINIDRMDTYVNGRAIPGRYRVRNNIAVTIRNVDKASAIIDAAVAAGASEMSGLTFSISDTSSLMREARTKAMQDAQETAALLAGASGCKIGDAVMIAEGDAGERVGPRTFSMRSTVMADTAATPVSAGDVNVTADVTVTYLMQ